MTIDSSVRALLQEDRDRNAALLVEAEATLADLQNQTATQAALTEALRQLVASLDAALVEA